MSEIAIVCLALTAAFPVTLGVLGFILYKALKHIETMQTIGGEPVKAFLQRNEFDMKRRTLEMAAQQPKVVSQRVRN